MLIAAATKVKTGHAGFDIENPDETARQLVPMIHAEIPVIGIDFQINEVMSVQNLLAMPVPVARKLHHDLGLALKKPDLVETSAMPVSQNEKIQG